MADDGMGIKINSDDVMKGFKAMISVTENLRPLLEKIIGSREGNPAAWTIRGSVKYNFENQVSNRNVKWDDLSPQYAAWKEKHAPGMPLLKLSGALYEALIRGKSGQSGVGGRTPVQVEPVEIYQGRKANYGVSAPYAARLQFDSPQRPYMGLRQNQDKVIGLEVRKYMVEAFRAKRAPQGGK